MIVLDIETTGIEKEKHAIASIGAVDYKNPQNRFYGECRIPDDAEINPLALKINGFTEEQLRNPKKQVTPELLDSFAAWALKIEDRTLGGENIRWDRDFLQHNLDRFKISFKTGYRTVDLHTVSLTARRLTYTALPIKDGVSAISLDETLRYVGLEEEPKPHNALTGALLEAEAFSRIWYAKSLLEEFTDRTIPGYLKRI